jgi:pimeloyl-ACP methyl ester carboxylesterase
MKKSVLAAVAVAVAAAFTVGAGQPSHGEVAGVDAKGHGHYADVNGLHMYYEVHGKDGGTPLVLLHGALSATDTSFGTVIKGLSKTRRVISIEQQAHGHTADIDRPLRTSQMSDDTAALLRKIGVGQADVLGYSMGAGIALDLGIRHADLVRKLVLTSVTYNTGGIHPGLLDGLDQLRPEDLYGSPFHEEYLRVAPRPGDFGRLVERVKDLNRNIPDLPADAIRALKAPTLLVIGDSDLVRPEHAVEMFRLLGGGVFGDVQPMPKSQLAIVPGASHVSIMHRPEVLLPIIPAFLDN